MHIWRLLVRMPALATLILCCWGFGLLGSMLRRELSHPLNSHNAPHAHTVFLIMNVVNVCFLTAMIATSLALLLLRPAAIKIYTFLYISIFIYTFAQGVLWISPWGTSIAAASGVGDMGLAPLVLFPVPFAYGIVSVLLVNLASRKLQLSMVAT